MLEVRYQNSTELFLGGECLIGDPSGALFWPEHRVLIVADLHLEKGSSFALRGVMLPPYDTAATLAKVAAAIARFDPDYILALGDSFHDRDGGQRLSAEDHESLLALQRGRDWVWISGNHDPEKIEKAGGSFHDVLRIGPLTFRHDTAAEDYEIVGHYHPIARISVRGQALRRRCFASSQRRIVMPAFGAFTGGLNVRHDALTTILGTEFLAHLLGSKRVYSLKSERCLDD